MPVVTGRGPMCSLEEDTYFEFVEEHHDFYEMVFVLTDDNTTVLIVPKSGSDPLLLKLCQEFS